MNFVILSVVLSVYVSYTTSNVLPSYLEKCSISNNFDECFEKHANLAIPKMLNGDKNIKLPSFNPLIINEVIFSPSNALKIHLTDVKISGFDDVKIINGHYNKSADTISFTLKVTKLLIEGKYKAKGKILIVPIEGEGPCHIQIVNPKYRIHLKFDNFNAENKENIKLKETNVEYKVEKSIYNFENLFNGNKQLGDELNRFLNENHAEIRNDFAPIFINIIQSIVQNVIHQTIGHLKYEDVILP